MIKGVYKNIVVIKSPKSDIFEEAIFILKPEACKAGIGKTDMITEAVRLLKTETNGQAAKKSTFSFRRLEK